MIETETETAFTHPCLISRNHFYILNMSVQDYRVDYSGVEKIRCLKTVVLIKFERCKKKKQQQKTPVSHPDCDRHELNDKEKDTL